MPSPGSPTALIYQYINTRSIPRTPNTQYRKANALLITQANHHSRSTAHASKYTNKSNQRKAESLQVALMMIATSGTQNAL